MMAAGRDDFWFVPKRYGFGATPATWQGWLVTFVAAGAFFATIHYLPTTAEKVIVSLAILAVLITITAQKTYGGLHWRWGSEDGQ